MCLQVHADMPLYLNFMNYEDLDVHFSFKPDPASRHIGQQLLQLSATVCLSVDLINLENLAMSLPGLHLEGVRVQQSALSQRVSHTRMACMHVAPFCRSQARIK